MMNIAKQDSWKDCQAKAGGEALRAPIVDQLQAAWRETRVPELHGQKLPSGNGTIEFEDTFNHYGDQPSTSLKDLAGAKASRSQPTLPQAQQSPSKPLNASQHSRDSRDTYSSLRKDEEAAALKSARKLAKYR